MKTIKVTYLDDSYAIYDYSRSRLIALVTMVDEFVLFNVKAIEVY